MPDNLSTGTPKQALCAESIQGAKPQTQSAQTPWDHSFKCREVGGAVLLEQSRTPVHLERLEEAKSSVLISVGCQVSFQESCAGVPDPARESSLKPHSGPKPHSKSWGPHSAVPACPLS